MEIYLNETRVGSESTNIVGIAKGYMTGNLKNKIVIQLAFGDGNSYYQKPEYFEYTKNNNMGL